MLVNAANWSSTSLPVQRMLATYGDLPFWRGVSMSVTMGPCRVSLTVSVRGVSPLTGISSVRSTRGYHWPA